MGWFDEQIRQRIRSDDEAFSEAFSKMADVVLGEKLSKTLSDSRVQTKDAIDEILRYYHVKPAALPEDVKELDDVLEYLLRPAGIMRRAVNLTEGWYRDASGAMLGMRKDDGTPVALLPRKFSGYDFYDAKTGKRERIDRHNASLIDEEAVCFYRPLPMKKLGVADLIRFIIGTLTASDLVMIALAAAGSTLVGLLIPKLNNIIYAHVIGGTNLTLLYAVCSFLLCVTLSQTLLSVTQSLLMDRISGNMDVAVQSAGMMRLLSMPPAFFRGYTSGELSSRVAYLNSICSLLVQSVLSTGLTTVFSLAYVAQMFRYGPGLVVPGILVILFTVVFSLVSVLVRVRYSRRYMEAAAKENGLSYSLITGVQKIKLSGAEKRAFSKWADAYAQYADAFYNPPALLKFSGVITTCISLVGTIVIYFFTIETGVALADYYAFIAAYGMVMGAFTALVGAVESFSQVKPMMNMVKPLLETVPEVAESKRVVTRLHGGLELNNVSFRYDETARLIIDDLTLKIRPGQYVAIVGSTGCGKSTLLRLMLGFEAPQKGAVYYDGVDISSLDLRSLRRNIGVVMQDGKLFSGDIYSNITITAPWLSLDDAWQAAETAGIADDIRRMPMGMHTLISDGSGGISGGQRQRLLIAAAIAPKPRILMFDEATSALDNLTQKQVSDALARLKCTRIVIAHRLSTIKQCDRIIVLDGGKIIEDGTYDALLAEKGFFASLVARQRLGDA